MVSYDLLEESQDKLQALVSGVHWIIHTAVYVSNKVDDPVKDVIEPAINGTLRILQAAQAVSTVTKSCFAQAEQKSAKALVVDISSISIRYGLWR